MRIISPFRDYYDYIAKKYGGGDPRIVYTRKRIAEPVKYFHNGKALYHSPPLEIPIDFQIPPIEHFYMWRFASDLPCEYAFLVVAAKTYLIKKPIDSPYDGYTLVKKLHLENVPSWLQRDFKKLALEIGVEQKGLIRFSRIVGHPVFIIQGMRGGGLRGKQTIVKVPRECPILADIGVQKMVTAELMYQDLAYFVGNLMKESPDVKPPVDVSNKEKIVKAGFDLVKSFRHRV